MCYHSINIDLVMRVYCEVAELMAFVIRWCHIMFRNCYPTAMFQTRNSVLTGLESRDPERNFWYLTALLRSTGYNTVLLKLNKLHYELWTCSFKNYMKILIPEAICSYRCFKSIFSCLIAVQKLQYKKLQRPKQSDKLKFS